VKSQHTTEHPLWHHPWFVPGMIFLLAFTTHRLVGVPTGFEWDGEAILAGSTFLEEGNNGLFPIYRYHWQPLSFSFFHLLTEIPGGFALARLTPGLFGGVALALLAFPIRQLAGGRQCAVLSLMLILLVPELIYTLLYFNTSTLAFPWLTGSIALAYTTLHDPDRSRRFLLASAALATIAGFFRADFYLAIPMLTWLIWRHIGTRSTLAWFVSGVATTLGLGAICGLFDPVQLLVILRLHQQDFGVGLGPAQYWSFSQSVEAAFSCLHPLAWLGLLATVTAWGLAGRRDKTAWTIIGPLPFLLAPLSSLASPKYALPALVFVPLAFAWGLARCRLPLTRRLLSISIAIILAIQVIPLDLRIRPPFVVWNTGPKTSIYTHDGPRSTSGYALAYCRLHSASFVIGRFVETIVDKIEASTAKHIVIYGNPIPESVLTTGQIFGFLPLTLAERGATVTLHRHGYLAIWQDRHILAIATHHPQPPEAIHQLKRHDWLPIYAPDDGFQIETWRVFAEKLSL